MIFWRCKTDPAMRVNRPVMNVPGVLQKTTALSGTAKMCPDLLSEKTTYG